jgi:uncharacterized membrane protein (DUF485 family)
MVLPKIPTINFYTNDPYQSNSTLDMSTSVGTDNTAKSGYSDYISSAYDLENVDNNTNTMKRHAQVSEFYLLKYNKQIYLLKIIIFTCCIALIGSILYNYGMIPSNMYTLYLGGVFGVGIILVMYNIFDIYSRNNNSFNEYDYLYNPNTAVSTSKLSTAELANIDDGTTSC